MNAGDVLANRFELRDLLGEGGMGQVFRAWDRTNAEDVAIKTLLPQIASDPLAAEELQREVRLSQKLAHPAIVKVYEYQVHNRLPFIVMEFVDGQPLNVFQYHQPGRRLDERTFVTVADQVLDAVAHAHSLGIVHRDLKPANVMVRAAEIRAAERSLRTTLLDFGIATAVRATYTRVTGQAMGLTIQYAAPEQIKGEDPTPAMDLYALGCMFYELLCGRPPFHQGDILYQQLTKAPPTLRDVPTRLNGIVLKCLEKDPARRFASADEVRIALSGNRTIKVRRPGGVVSPNRSTATSATGPVIFAPTPVPEARRHSSAPSMLFAAAAALAVLGAVVWFDRPSSTGVAAPSAVEQPPATAPVGPLKVAPRLETGQPAPAAPSEATPPPGPVVAPRAANPSPPTTTPAPPRAPGVDVAGTLSAGSAAMNDGSYDRAIQLFETVLKAEPGNQRARTGIAQARRAREAEQAVLGGLSSSGAAAPQAGGDAQALMDQGRYEEAIAAYQTRLALNPGDAAARLGLERARKAKEAEDRVLGRRR